MRRKAENTFAKSGTRSCFPAAMVPANSRSSAGASKEAIRAISHRAAFREITWAPAPSWTESRRCQAGPPVVEMRRASLFREGLDPARLPDNGGRLTVPPLPSVSLETAPFPGRSNRHPDGAEPAREERLVLAALRCSAVHQGPCGLYERWIHGWGGGPYPRIS